MKKSYLLRKMRAVDPLLFAATIGLICFGMIMVYSASSLLALENFGDHYHYLRRHFVAIVLGMIGFGISFLLKPRAFKLFALPGLLLTGTLLVATAFTNAGLGTNNATRWIALGGLNFQPSELAKLAVVLYVAHYLARKRDIMHDFMRCLVPLLLTVGMYVILILRQPDFGTSAVLLLTVGAMLFVARARLLHLTSLATIFGIVTAFLVYTSPYRWRRVTAFLDPWEDAHGSGFQIIQSFVAFYRGGIQGQGLGDGTQKLLYLPEAHTDFVFAVIAEELGLIGSLIVIICFLCIVIQGLRLSMRLGEPFASLLAFGLTTLIGLQAALNIAVVMGLLPTKGMTLPLISYGGSSLLVTMIALGMLLSLSATVSMNRPSRRSA